MEEYQPEAKPQTQGIPLEEGIPLEDNLDKVVASEKKHEDSLGDTALRALALAGEGASFGLAPKAVALFGGKKNEEDYIKYLNESREKLGPWGSAAAEIGGGMLVPIPGLGALKAGLKVGKAGASILGSAGRSALAHGTVGAVASGVSRAGETPMQEWQDDPLKSLASTGEAAAFGGVLGGALGGVGAGAKTAFNRSKDILTAGATGGGKSDINSLLSRYSGRQAGEKDFEKVLDMATRGNAEYGIRPMLGTKPLQSVHTTLSRVQEGRQNAGKQLEMVRDALSQKATHMNLSIQPSALENHLISEITSRAEGMPKDTALPIINHIQAEIADEAAKNGGRLTIESVNKLTGIFQDLAYNPTHEGAIIGSNPKKLFAYTIGKLTNLENKMAQSIDPKLGRDLVNLKEIFHGAAALTKPATSGVLSEKTLMQTNPLGPDFGGLRGFMVPAAASIGIGQGGGWLAEEINDRTGHDVPLLRYGSRAAQILALAHAGAVQRGRMNNTYLWADKVARGAAAKPGVAKAISRLPSSTARTFGKQLAPKPPTEQDIEDVRRGLGRY